MIGCTKVLVTVVSGFSTGLSIVIESLFEKGTLVCSVVTSDVV